jgi:hypothetical protein
MRARPAPLQFSSTGNPACASESPQRDRARQARLATSFFSHLTSTQRRHRLLASRRTAPSNLRHRQECLCYLNRAPLYYNSGT